MENKKVVIITGAAGGIGLATAKKFAENNFCIVLSDINQDGLNKAVEILEKEYEADCLVCHGNLEDINYIENINDHT